jgi:rhamnosyltransferase subunit B
MARIVLSTLGSYGDLHPYLGLAKALQARGHLPVVATSRNYQAKIEAEGVEFAPLRPDLSDLSHLGDVNTIMQRVNELRTGTEFAVRSIWLANLEKTYADLLQALAGADLLVNHSIVYAGPVAAAKLELPWVSSVLSPVALFSTVDPPLFAQAPWLRGLHQISPRLYRALFRLVQWRTLRWGEPVYRLREQVGLPKPAANPIMQGSFSPHLNLALFSPALARPQSDWPANTQVTGFVFYDHDPVDAEVQQRLEDFLAAHGRPLVFTLGTAAVYDPGDFYRVSAQAARRLGKPAILVTGRDPANRPEDLLGASPEEGQHGRATITAFDYVPFSWLFPRALVNIHQGGVGTFAQALRAGRPMVVMPYSHDQPDNADRAERLCLGRALARNEYTVQGLLDVLQPLLENPAYEVAATRVAQEIRREDGAKAACDCIEELLARL